MLARTCASETEAASAFQSASSLPGPAGDAALGAGSAAANRRACPGLVRLRNTVRADNRICAIGTVRMPSAQQGDGALFPRGPAAPHQTHSTHCHSDQGVCRWRTLPGLPHLGAIFFYQLHQSARPRNCLRLASVPGRRLRVLGRLACMHRLLPAHQRPQHPGCPTGGPPNHSAPAWRFHPRVDQALGMYPCEAVDLPEQELLSFPSAREVRRQHRQDCQAPQPFRTRCIAKCRRLQRAYHTNSSCFVIVAQQ
jgi:hypothetical protein